MSPSRNSGFGVTSHADVGTISGGVVSPSRRETWMAALMLFDLVGFIFRFFGPLAVGLALI